MFYVELQYITNISTPFLHRLSGEAVHQVDADVANACRTEQLNGPRHLQGAVSTAQKAQPLVAERLGTHTHSVDWQFAE